MKGSTSDVLESLTRHELAVKRLYEVFAVRFADRKDFWNQIAAEEQEHADLLESLRDESVISQWLSTESRLKANAVKLATAYVETQTAAAEAGQLSAVQALSIGRDIEGALLEKGFYRVGDFIPKEIRPFFARLNADSARHRASMAAVLDAAKRKGM